MLFILSKGIKKPTSAKMKSICLFLFFFNELKLMNN